MPIKLSTAIIKRGNKILLLKRSNSVEHFTKYWQFPEGKVKGNEDPKEALKRELVEEIGLENIKDSELSFIGNKKLEYAGITAVRSIYICKKLPKKMRLSNAHTEYGWFSKNEVKKIKTVPGVEILMKEI